MVSSGTSTQRRHGIVPSTTGGDAGKESHGCATRPGSEQHPQAAHNRPQYGQNPRSGQFNTRSSTQAPNPCVELAPKNTFAQVRYRLSSTKAEFNTRFFPPCVECVELAPENAFAQVRHRLSSTQAVQSPRAYVCIDPPWGLCGVHTHTPTTPSLAIGARSCYCSGVGRTWSSRHHHHHSVGKPSRN